MTAMYEHAKSLHEERVRAAEQARLVAELRRTNRSQRRAGGISLRDEWRVVWASSDLTGKAVAMVNTATGEKRIGRDPADWDRALGHAVRQLHVGV